MQDPADAGVVHELYEHWTGTVLYTVPFVVSVVGLLHVHALATGAVQLEYEHCVAVEGYDVPSVVAVVTFHVHALAVGTLYVPYEQSVAVNTLVLLGVALGFLYVQEPTATGVVGAAYAQLLYT